MLTLRMILTARPKERDRIFPAVLSITTRPSMRVLQNTAA